MVHSNARWMGFARTTVLTISTPVLMTDNGGTMTLAYDAEFVRMTRGGPTAANMTAATEDVADETLVCDDSSSVSFFIDDGGGCPSPMTSSGSSYFARPPAASGRQLCYPDRNMECAAGFTAVLGPLVTQIPYCYE